MIEMVAMDYFYIFMIIAIFSFLVSLEVQIHTLKSLVEKYIEIRLDPKTISDLAKKNQKPLTKK